MRGDYSAPLDLEMQPRQVAEEEFHDDLVRHESRGRPRQALLGHELNNPHVVFAWVTPLPAGGSPRGTDGDVLSNMEFRHIVF